MAEPAGIKNTYSLIVANALTIAIAIIFDTPARLLIVPYWIQSLVIGYYSRRRILELDRFSTEGFQVNDTGFSVGGSGRPAAATEDTKRLAARKFTEIYFGFHVCYPIFLVPMFVGFTPYNWLAAGIAAVPFVWNHHASFKRNAEADRRGTTNIGTLVGLPFARVVPMQLVAVLGGAIDFQGVGLLLMFGALKTGADVWMHMVEHRKLQTGSAGPTTGQSSPQAEAAKWSGEAEAARWFRRAVSRGDADAQFNLGRMLAQGAGVPQDFAEAVTWYRLAAEQGKPTAQHNLGLLYAQGQGVPQDFAEAVKWLDLAVSRLPPGTERETALKNRDLIAQKTTPAQILEAQRRAQQWKPKKPPWWMRKA